MNTVGDESVRKEGIHSLGGDTGFDGRASARHGSALKRVDKIYGRILSVCSYCHSFRGDDGKWHPLGILGTEKSERKFSHGICPSCAEALYPELYEALTAKRASF